MKVPVNHATLLRLIVLSVGAFVFAALSPALGDPFAGQASFALAVLTGTMLALLISQATRRRQRLFEAVRKELNKLRRLYHIAKNMSSSSQKFRGWFTDLHGYVYGYLTSFGGKDFDAYEGSNGEFRKLTYHVYTVPEIETKKEEALFNDLLCTTGVIADSRQLIKETWDARLSAYSWIVVLLMSAGFIMTAVMSMANTTASRLATGATVAAVLLALDLLWEIDTMASEKKTLAGRYADNIGRLELGRRNDL